MCIVRFGGARDGYFWGTWASTLHFLLCCTLVNGDRGEKRHYQDFPAICGFFVCAVCCVLAAGCWVVAVVAGGDARMCLVEM